MFFPCLSREVDKNSLVDPLAIFPGYLVPEVGGRNRMLDVQQHWSANCCHVRVLWSGVLKCTYRQPWHPKLYGGREEHNASRNISVLVKTESHAQRIAIDSFSAPCQHQLPYGPLQGSC